MEYCNIQHTDDLLTRLGDSKQIESRIIDFIVSNKDTESHSYRCLKLAALTAFYSINDIQLNRRKLGKFVGEKVKVIKDRAYTFEETHKMLDVADTRGRAISCC
jgi:hypothetical protein